MTLLALVSADEALDADYAVEVRVGEVTESVVAEVAVVVAAVAEAVHLEEKLVA